MFTLKDKKVVVREELRLSETAWQIETQLSRLRQAYGQGRFDTAVHLATQIGQMLQQLPRTDEPRNP